MRIHPAVRFMFGSCLVFWMAPSRPSFAVPEVEQYSSRGVMDHWGQVTGTILNSPIAPHTCFLP